MKKKDDTKGGGEQAEHVVVAHAEIRHYVDEEGFQWMLQHHLNYRRRVGPDFQVSGYDVGKDNDPCIVVSNDEATLVTVAFKDGMLPMLQEVLRNSMTVLH